MTLTSRVFGMTGLKMEDTVEWHADANFCRAPSFMLDRMQDPDNLEDFRHAGMIGPVECLWALHKIETKPSQAC